MNNVLDRLSIPAGNTGKSTVVHGPAGFTHHPDYDALPEAIKAAVTAREYAWMSDLQRDNITADMTEPDEEG